MWYRHLDNLFDGRNKREAILRRDQVFLFLLGDAANTTSIAARRDGNRHLPTSKKEIAGRRTRVIQRTVRVLRNYSILWKSRLFLLYQSRQRAFRKGTRMPFMRVIGLDGRDI